MAMQYSAEFLLFLRDSPLCVRPANLPPAEEWMGSAAEHNSRSVPKTPALRGDGSLLDQTNRRIGDRHASRNTANADEIVFGPPRMAFSSARGNKMLDLDKSSDDLEATQTRLALRSRGGENDGDRLREGRNLRADDSDGWSMVKPRKSFGAEGADRFQGKMGGNFREERRPVRDRDERDGTRDRPTRPFEGFGREKSTAEGEVKSRNGMGRSKTDTWRPISDSKDTPVSTEKRERDRNKSWRERDQEQSDDRATARAPERRWGRESQRVERDPEWLDEPQVEQREAHTQQDFQRWMEQMKATKSAAPASSKPSTSEAAPGGGTAPCSAPAPPASVPVSVYETVKRQPPPAAVETGPDKFFMAFAANAVMDPAGTAEQKDVATKAKASGKSSRFTSFFSQAQHEGKARSEASTPMTGPPVQESGLPAVQATLAPEEERQAFQQLLAKLQQQSTSATPRAFSPYATPQADGTMDAGSKHNVASPESFQNYGGEGRNGPLGRPPSQQAQEIVAPRPEQRASQHLLELVGRSHGMTGPSPQRTDSAARISKAEFLTTLMRTSRETDLDEQQQQQLHLQQQQHLRMREAQGQKMPVFCEREPEIGREPRAGQRQMRPQPPPGFPMDEGFHLLEQEQRPSQPGLMLQRQMLPPGLDQMPPEWMTRGVQMPPPPPPPPQSQPQQQQRGPMLPPPGLAGGPNRNVPLPHHMFPPNFALPGAMPPPPDAMMPPRTMGMPPPGFFGGPPHVFVPPGLGGFNPPPGPEALHHHVQQQQQQQQPHGAPFIPPFEARNMHPTGNRGAAYGRP
ncbi:hypothetical protein CDD81_800 [Ophiocordyceps australis]|uniref:Uncharacterized protein n=1 Tax=Ophiocordyceps australis TaxID=1399860 RepID=A0A2C5X8D7_9HYPO|nr:hypothetical protein CDD81_800 [Ophiocordyceps australis]